jgi:PAS domain S-box-containing protein
MTTPLRLLLVEDSEDDACLVVRELERGGFGVSVTRIESEAELTRALEARDGWDLVISDYALPQFDAPRALGIVRGRDLDVPFIIVSGAVDEATAVDSMKAGAQDFIVKDRLARLVPAVARELGEAGARSAKRRAEQALRISEMRFRRLAESGMIGVAITDTSGAVLEANEAFLQILGYSEHDLRAGRIRWAVTTPLESEPATNAALAQLRAQGVAPPFERECVLSDGRRVPMLVAAATLEDSTLIALCLDLSERKQLEEQVRRAQKMEAVGALAGGVAHDFNNMLSVILSYAGLLIAETSPGDPLRSGLEEIQKAGDRAAELTRRLLAFSRHLKHEPRALDPNRIIAGMRRMLERIVGEDVDLSITTASDAGTIRADPGQIEQVVMNLVVNARDAMPGGGRLALETARIVLDDESAARRVGARPGSYALIAVTDTGIGMDDATLGRIFEPFFSTKEPGKGTGLGLSTVYGIVQQSGGHLVVHSQPGRGSTFQVYLPVTGAEADPAIPEAPLGRLRGSETILVVEDEPQVRATMRAVLARFGYDVLDAQNAGEALLVSEEHKAPIDLLVTDVVLPRMSGCELAVRLTRTRPDMRVLYVSGYTGHAVLQERAPDVIAPFFEKPITPEPFVRRVRDVLDTSRPR